MRLFIVFLLFIASCSSKESSESSQKKGAKIEFDSKEVDFGTLVEGDAVSHTFSFTNTGTDPLEIFEVQVSCGCTVAEKPERPIGVGQKGEITIQFNSQGKLGANKKSIAVYSNASTTEELLYFTANVKAKNQ